MTQTVDGRSGGSGRRRTSRTPFNIKSEEYVEKIGEFFDLKGQTVNQEYFLDVLIKLRERMRKKRPELWKKKPWILHEDNTSAHNALAVKQILADKCISVLEYPPPPIHRI
jgi:hypothetical protein